MKTQKICTSILVILICFVSFFMGFTKSFSVPVYADNIPDGYSPCGLNDQVDAFRSYCYSRNLAIEGSGLDAVTSFTSDAYQGLIKKSGFDINELQNQIYKNTNNIGAKWFFTSTGISAYNRLFSEFLQNNNLSVGDSANQNDNTVYSGKYYSNSLITIGNSERLSSSSNLVQLGTGYVYGENWFNGYSNSSNVNQTVEYLGHSITYYHIRANSREYWQTINSTSTIFGRIFSYRNTTSVVEYNGFLGIYYDITNDKYYLSTISYYVPNSGSPYYVSWNEVQLTNVDPTPATIYLSTNNTTINNNTYEGDTYITNEGDVVTNEGDDITYNPYPDGGGTTTDPNSGAGGSGTDGTINFPDLNFNLPEINWSLGDLSQKFPFSIPFDLISFFTLINAEPEAPRIDADIPLGSWYTWEFEADFGQFENYAAIVRNVEFIGFCVGLIYITIRLVKG